MLNTGNAEYERIQDKAKFCIAQADDGSYSITCKVNGEKFGWPVPAAVPVVQGLPDETTAETILMRLRQMDIDAHAQLLFQYQPTPTTGAPVEEPSFKKDKHQ